MKQNTIKNEVKLSGVGIHTGKKINAVFKPASIDSGVNFIRIDLPSKPVIKADLSNLLDPSLRVRRTSIGKEGIEAHTIEHIMATFLGLGIDNICVEIDGPELPVMDGSAKEIVDAIKKAGITQQDALRKELIIEDPIWIDEGDSAIIALPSDGFSISYILDYNHPALKTQYNHFKIDNENFKNNIAPSRTFCLKEEISALHEKGLGKGGSSSNTVVIDENGNPMVELRFKDEFLRHKILDIMGDIFLTGYSIKAHIIGIKSGHLLNLKMAQSIKKQYIAQQKTNTITARSKKVIFDKEAIKKILPHREPFLLVDEIVELGELTATGIKYVDEKEYYFPGHFPGRPIMPGVLMLEALAQVGGVLMLNKPQNKGKLAYFMSINNAKFRKTVVPGDKLRLEIEVIKAKTKTGQVHGKAFVGEKLACEADLMFSLVQ